MKTKASNQIGFSRKVHEVREDYKFNGRVIRKGLKTDGGSIPKIFIIGSFLLINAIYDFHWITTICIFAIAIDESNGWFFDPFALHDQTWQDAQNWKDFFMANWLFHKDMIYQVNNYENKYPVKAFFHMPLGYLLAIIYPLAVTLFAWVVFYFKYYRTIREV